MRAFLGIAGVLCVCCVLFVGTAYASDAEELQPDNADAARQSDVGEVTVSAVPSDSPDVVEKVTEPQGDTSVSTTSPEVSPVFYDDYNNPITEEVKNSKANPTYWDVWNDYNTFFPSSINWPADDGTELTGWNITARSWLISKQVVNQGHVLTLPKGLWMQTRDNTVQLKTSVQSLSSDVDTVKSDVATIKQQLPNTGSGLTSAQWTELTNDLKTQNTLLLVLVCVLAAVLGSNVAPMLVKGWRR